MRIDRQLKQELADELCAILQGWTTTQAVGYMGFRPSRISEIRHGKLAGFSIGRILRMIASHRYAVHVSLKPALLPTASVVRYDRYDRVVSRPRAAITSAATS